MGVRCAGPGLRQTARRKGKHCQPASADWLLRKLQLRRVHGEIHVPLRPSVDYRSCPREQGEEEEYE